jgi:signal transduction histidine kinase
MRAGSAARVTLWRVLVWPLIPAIFVGSLLLEHQIAQTGYVQSETLSSPGIAAFVAALLACWIVGIVLTLRVPRNAVGWLFLALTTSMAAGGILGDYAEYTLRAAPGRDLPLGELSAVLADASFAWWFLFLALCLQLTPTGHPLSQAWRRVMWLTIGSAIVFQVGALLRSTPLETPNADISSPLAIESLAGPIAAIAAVAIIVQGLCVVASVVVIIVRFRASRDEQRQQMLWLVVGISPLPLCIVASFAASYADYDDLAVWPFALGLVSVAVGAGFSVARYRLFGVEVVVSRAVAYVLTTAAIVLAYAAVVVVITGSIPGVGSRSTATTVVSTLAAAAIALPAYRWARDAADRRFNRRGFEAIQIVRAGLATPSPDLDQLIPAALRDQSVRLLFPAANGSWVTSDGRAVVASGNAVEVVRRGTTAARIEYDADQTDRTIVETVAAEAAAEIDNLGLRAELARQLQEIRESRTRLAGAHLEERRRMERDLHDGAQQRLLAIALQLQSARVNGSTDLLREEAARAIEQLGIAVHELRDLANGLQPSSLASGGLRAAVEDLAERIPLRLSVDLVDQRFAPAVEGAAWFVIAEAVSNAVKYADVDEVEVQAAVLPTGLHIRVADRGVGGAARSGGGLQGLLDRVAALGGELHVSEVEPHGTRVEAVLPCES